MAVRMSGSSENAHQGIAGPLPAPNRHVFRMYPLKCVSQIIFNSKVNPTQIQKYVKSNHNHTAFVPHTRLTQTTAGAIWLHEHDKCICVDIHRLSKPPLFAFKGQRLSKPPFFAFKEQPRRTPKRPPPQPPDRDTPRFAADIVSFAWSGPPLPQLWPPAPAWRAMVGRGGWPRE